MPAAKGTEPLKRTGNTFPLFGPRKNTGNRVSVPSFSIFAANPFTGHVPLTSDLEPDRSDYFQFLLLTGNLFMKDLYIHDEMFIAVSVFI